MILQLTVSVQKGRKYKQESLEETAFEADELLQADETNRRTRRSQCASFSDFT